LPIKPQPIAADIVSLVKGEITVMDGQVFVSSANGKQAVVALDPNAQSVFLVYASVPEWRSVVIPTNTVSEPDLAAFLQSQLSANTHTAFLVQKTAVRAQYHIQPTTRS